MKTLNGARDELLRQLPEMLRSAQRFDELGNPSVTEGNADPANQLHIRISHGLAEAVVAALEHLAQESLRRQAAELAALLRRHSPGVVAEVRIEPQLTELIASFLAQLAGDTTGVHV